MKRLFISLLLILVLACNAFGVGVVRVQSEQTYEALSPATLTAYKALSFLPSDILSISSGSAIGGATTITECVDSNQGTICFWYYPYNSGNAGQNRFLYDCYVNSNNYYRVWIYGTTIFLDTKNNGTTRLTSISFATIKPFTWNHIVATWSKNTTVNGTNYLAIYLNGVLGSASTSAPLAMTSVPSTFSIGSDYLGKNSANGLLAYKIMRNWMTSDQVTADYNSGSGSLDFFTVTPHCIALGLTSESSTGVKYSHRGKAYTAIADGATEDTVTTSAGSDTSFADNDRVILSAGNGYSSNAIGNTFVDGTPSSTSVNVDDGAGADTGLLEKIGVCATLNGSSQYFKKTNPTNIDVTTDYTVMMYIKTSSSNMYIFQKDGASDYGFAIKINNDGTLLNFLFNNGGTHASYISVSSIKVINDNKWHYVGFTYDDAPTPTITIYVDGYVDASSTTTTGTKDSGVGTIYIGYYVSGSFFNGSIQDVMVWTSLLTPANILTLATNPHSENGLSPQSWWVFDDDGTATTIADQATAGNNNHLSLIGGVTTNYSTHSRVQQGFLSRNLIVDGDMRQ